MRRSTTLLAAAASLGLLTAAAGTALAQSPGQGTRTIQVPEGAVVLVLPGGAMQVAEMPAVQMPFAQMPFAQMAAGPMMPVGLPGMPDIQAMFHQMDVMMANAQRAMAMPMTMAPDRTIEAAMRGLPQGNGVSSVTVTSFSDGHTTCTRRVTYAGDGAAPVVQVSGDSNACGMMTPSPARPAAQPDTVAPPATKFRTIEAANHVRVPARPIQLAQLGD